MFKSVRKNLIYITTSLVVFALSPAIAWAEADPDRGLKLYKVCASCHGFKGEGNELVNAPKLAGMSSWYLSRQIDNFRHKVRGSTSDDAHGQTMAAMTGAITSDVLAGDVVAYIETLAPTSDAASSNTGNAATGKNLYATCVACHGDKAQGNQAMNAPSLVQLDGWYQIAQLKKFQNGQRGRHPEDVYGQQMAPMAGMLTDEAAIADVVAYIGSLAD